MSYLFVILHSYKNNVKSKLKKQAIFNFMFVKLVENNSSEFRWSKNKDLQMTIDVRINKLFCLYLMLMLNQIL